MSKQNKWFCHKCNKVEIPEPIGCCNGRECGCMGQPTEPPFCPKCWDEIKKDKLNKPTKIITHPYLC